MAWHLVMVNTEDENIPDSKRLNRILEHSTVCEAIEEALPGCSVIAFVPTFRDLAEYTENLPEPAGELDLLPALNYATKISS